MSYSYDIPMGEKCMNVRAYLMREAAVRVSDEKRDIQQLKEQINALETQVQSLKNSNQRRSFMQNFFIAFFIVLVVVIVSIGVINYINN